MREGGREERVGGRVEREGRIEEGRSEREEDKKSMPFMISYNVQGVYIYM